jgi:large subunit ribosomal protein L9
MKVILRKEVLNLGEADTVAEVSRGYARNYLLPKKMAITATKAEIAAAEKRKAERDKKLSEKRAEFEDLAKKISSLEIVVPADAGEGGRLFGSVTTQDIALAVKGSANIELDKRKIEINEPIKTLGEHSVLVKLSGYISANLKVKVIAK